MTTRKDTETYRLETEIGINKIFECWYEVGMYRTAYRYRTSPYVIRYLANKHEWKRPAEKAPIILKGVKAGNVKSTYYKNLIFNEEQQKCF